MKLPSRYAVGVCSHTGLLRSGNEDDYLLATAADGDLLVAIADGMGGVAGGAEASRTALRALGATVVDGAVAGADERLRRGFRAASGRVFESAAAVPALRDMGTTLTALVLSGDEALVGHIGDTRLYRRRAGRSEALTTDHAVSEGESLLTRCIGAGQLDSEVDELRLPVQPGDRFLLATDGVWNVVPADELDRLLAERDPQQAAEKLVRRALDLGGPDNATAVVVERGPAAPGEVHDVELPRHERPEAHLLWPRPESLRPPVWPWLLLLGATALLLNAVLRLAGVDGLALLAAAWR
ncbi:MAG: serine/threonine-protein phosphatase [Planctomycetes bacterium]|nr:serine/threonine-protein phosphatase [Planctomycetota bacterium]